MPKADKQKIKSLLEEYQISIVANSHDIRYGLHRHHFEIKQEILNLITVDPEPTDDWIPNVPQWFKERPKPVKSPSVLSRMLGGRKAALV